MQKHGYRDLAKIYDLINQKKDYAGEVDFLKALFEKYNVETVLDAGCGTGTHMKLLEDYGFRCEGIDINKEMLDIAKEKVKGSLTQADMTDFNLKKKYDAIICMFAAFNHLTEPDSATKAIKCFEKHLNPGGILLIDLHNPKGNGKKIDTFGKIQRQMKWDYNIKTQIETSSVIFNVDGKKIEDDHMMKIYSVEEILDMFEKAGFSKSTAYEGYGFNPAKPTSKNLEIFAKLN
ncbi:MAG: methyltransferase domain-containing protein [Nanoarchaeota archaeon]|jgi:ubiquinone/menaquinone biosynthesis C-methylase UbiE|nr:methyltransferase domain-containing protein [Nanoarchaeota archaeon]